MANIGIVTTKIENYDLFDLATPGFNDLLRLFRV